MGYRKILCCDICGKDETKFKDYSQGIEPPPLQNFSFMTKTDNSKLMIYEVVLCYDRIKKVIDFIRKEVNNES